MISVVRITHAAVRVLGAPTDPEWVPYMRRAMEAAGAMLQKFAERAYMTERYATAGKLRKLKANSRKWNQRKAAKGWSHLRGHQLNRIQRALRTQQLWAASGLVGGECIIQLNEMVLRHAQPHAGFYAKMKTEGGWILGITDVWARRVQSMLRAAESRYRAAREAKHRAEMKRARAAAKAEASAAREAKKAEADAKKARVASARAERDALAKEKAAGRAETAEARSARRALKAMDQGVSIHIGADGAMTWSQTSPQKTARKAVTLARTAWRAAALTEAKLRRL